MAKIDLAEVRAPFIKAGLIALGFTLLVVLTGALSFFKITTPVLRRLEHQAHELRVTNELMKQQINERVRNEEEIKWEGKVTAALSELYGPVISPSSSILDITESILDEAKGLTGSHHGYVSSIDPVNGDMIAHTFTAMMAEQCRVKEKDQRTLFPKGQDGHYPSLWGHSLNTTAPFITNSPNSHEASTGVPEGHISLERLLSVTVMLGKEPVGQIALANKESDYTKKDLEAVCRMAEYYALAIQRYRVEEELQKAHDDLESRVRERTALLTQANTLLTQEVVEHQRTAESLKQSEETLRRLSSKLLTAHEEESKRIGQELHDGLAQTLSAVKIWVENALIQLGQKDSVEAAKSLESVVPLARGPWRR